MTSCVSQELVGEHTQSYTIHHNNVVYSDRSQKQSTNPSGRDPIWSVSMHSDGCVCMLKGAEVTQHHLLLEHTMIIS